MQLPHRLALEVRRKPARLGIIKESALDSSLQGSLRPQLAHPPSSGKGRCGQGEDVGGSGNLESNGQLLLSFWGKRLWTALTSMEKGGSSRSKDWTSGWAEATILAIGQEREPGAKRRPLRRESFPTFISVGIPTQTPCEGSQGTALPQKKGREEQAFVNPASR